jgi:hypothetical protein
MLTGYRTKAAASITLAVLIAISLGAYLAFNFPVEATSAKLAGVTLYVKVVNSSSSLPMAEMTVMAGPITSPTDVSFTPAGPTLRECVHQVPSGSSVEANGSVLFPGGNLVTFPPCLLKEYVTDNSGMISIKNVTSEFYFFRAGNIMMYNAFVIDSKGTNAVSVTVPWPSGNVTLTQSSLPAGCVGNYRPASQSGITIVYETCTST